MFDAAQLKRLLALHEKSYGLLRWVNDGLKSGRRSLSSIGKTLAFSDAAARWVRANLAEIPELYRPDPGEVEEFAHLFVSYLATSFEVVDRARVSCHGCWCCSYWIANKHLRRRDPDKKARAVAHQLKLLYLCQLSEELELPLLDPELERFTIDAKELGPQLALATYVHELERRSRFASQGEGTLALWREIAWNPGGGPKKKFRLKVEDILKAEEAIQAKLAKT